jgi:hypothetical protein
MRGHGKATREQRTRKLRHHVGWQPNAMSRRRNRWRRQPARSGDVGVLRGGSSLPRRTSRERGQAGHRSDREERRTRGLGTRQLTPARAPKPSRTRASRAEVERLGQEPQHAADDEVLQCCCSPACDLLRATRSDSVKQHGERECGPVHRIDGRQRPRRTAQQGQQAPESDGVPRDELEDEGKKLTTGRDRWSVRRRRRG